MRARVIGAALLGLGLLQMGADALGLDALRGLANATAASPAPKVFTAVAGSEPFSTGFSIHWIDRDGRARSLALTPERYARLRGPYNRRNTYGAVVAAGPVLIERDATRDAFHAVSRHALCGPAPLLRELGIDPASVASPITLRYAGRPDADPAALPRALEVRCP